jgi:hypothetical protein
MRYLLIIFFATAFVSVQGQSKTTEALHKDNKEAFSLFFYHNTLRMINQTEDKELDELIKDIEKLKFLMIEKKSFGATEYKKLVGNYKSESFEEIMTSRYQGKNFDVFLQEKNGKTKGMVVTVNDASNLYILDIVGSIALDKVPQLFSKIDESSDIGKRIKAFTSKDDK